MATRSRAWAWEHLAGLILAVLWLALAFDGARRLSTAFDEVPHIGAGLTVLRYGDFRMNPEHPALFKVLAALPVELLAPPPLRYRIPGRGELVQWSSGNQWTWGHSTLFYDNPDPQRLVLLARVVPILAGMCGGLLAWWWGSQFGGRRAGLLAMALLFFYPEYLGHARFVTFDVPTLVAGAALCALAWSWWKRPRIGRAAALVAAAVVLPFVKLPVAFLALFLFAILGTLLTLRCHKGIPGTRTRLSAWLAMCGVVVVLGYGALWASNLFRFQLQSDHGSLDTPNVYATPQGPGQRLLTRIAWELHRHRVVPESAIAVLACMGAFETRPMFLQGEHGTTGWYRYFFVTIATKTPLAMLAGLPLAGVYVARVVRRRRGLAIERLAVLTVPFAILFLLAVQSRVNIGHRHVLFIYFPWAVLMGVELCRCSRRWKLAWVLPLLVIFECTLRQPNQATYFNTLAGITPYRASRLLADSNTDWGQDLPQGFDALKRHGWLKCNLAYFGMARPQAYGIGDFRFILLNYPMAVGMPDALPPDPKLPTLVSLNALEAVRALYPGRFDREPLELCNGMVLFAPEELQGAGGKAEEE